MQLNIHRFLKFRNCPSFKSIVFLLLIGLSFLPKVIAQNSYRQTQLLYVERYKDIAIREMERTGIPASIKLAQGLLESGAGSSDLAKGANNHFGIKCGNDWTGEIYHKEDDDYDTVGALQKSCFRAYSDPEASFIAHSEFLRNPLRQNRYGFLFKLDPTDYKSWAEGLQQAGYATNPNYPKLLIKSIEDLGLHQFDLPDYQRQEGFIPVNAKKTNVSEVFGLPIYFAKEGQTPVEIALETKAPLKRIMQWNEGLDSRVQALKAGQKVYLSKKHKKYSGPSKWHYVRKGESMFEISQQYGIRLDRLYKLNRLPEGIQVASGEKVQLKKKAKKNHPPRILFPEKETQNPVPQKTKKSTEQFSRLIHTVNAGDTLYSISKRYGISIATIQEQNHMMDTAIRPGQQLTIR
ncbi:MAG: glucosaminidase domain-containing protein [Saprospiraceae bacterium]